MKKDKANDQTPEAALVQHAAELAINSGTTGLRVLLTEMQALGSLLPGVEDKALTAEEQQARDRAHDAEVEADFDNMPV